MPGSSGSPPTAEVPNANSSHSSAVSACAKEDKYFPADPGASDVGVTDDLIQLKNLCAKLNASVEDVKTKAKGKNKNKVSGARSFDILARTEEQLDAVIIEMLGELTKGDGVSTFEFIGSGIVVELLNYFSCGTFGKDRVSEVNLSKLRHQGLRRYKSFIVVALPIGFKEVNDVPMTILVQKLQNALSSLEHFHVLLSNQPRSSSRGTARLSSGLSALAQPFKLCLCRAQGEKSLRDYSSNIVLIDPLASLAVVEEFPWPRIQRSDPGQKPSGSVGNCDAGATTTGAGAPSPSALALASGRRPSTRSRTSVTIGNTAKKDANEVNPTSSKGKGKAVLKLHEDTEGPQTMNSARRKAAADKDSETKPSHGDSSSEDEELDMSPDDI